jgi:toxin ParE1/3/4
VKVKRAVLREQASLDVQEAIDHYLGEGTPQAALGFVDSLEQALQHIERHPAIGSARYAHELDLPGLRCWQLKRYPYLVFYFERDDHVDVWRVLHASRDIPEWLQASE